MTPASNRLFICTAVAATALSLTIVPAASTARPNWIALADFTSVGGRLDWSGDSVGKVVHTADGGQVFGFDVDHSGDDGLLASAQTTSGQGQVKASVEIFSQSTAAITKIVARTNTMDDFIARGIFAGDEGVIEHEHVKSLLDVVRSFHVLDPVTGGSLNARLTPPNASGIIVEGILGDQTSSQDAFFAITKAEDRPLLFGADIATNTYGKVLRISSMLFSLGDQPQFASDIASGEVVFATSPDGGKVGGAVPLIGTIDLTTGAMHSFNGVMIPPFNSGFVNGLAVDTGTGIACTTTELDASVEFYTLSTGNGIAVQLPGSNGNQFNSGEAVAVDPIHHLFLVAQPNGTVGPPGSVVDIFDETGTLRKSISGFTAFGVTPQLVVNPNTRTGFISGPTPDAITEFGY